jgi:oxalate---CoA ligase
MNVATEIMRNDPMSPAFVEADDRNAPVLYRDLGPLIEQFATEADLSGLPRSARVALIMPRGKDGLLGFLAVSSYAICCPLDPRLLDEELVSAIRDLNVAMIVDGTGEQRIVSLSEQLKVGLRQVRVDELAVRQQQHHRPIGRTQADAVALLLQTSGTTSKPKHVALTHSNILAAAKAIATSYELGPRDLCINPMPHHHVHGLISAGTSSLLAGASQYCAPSFSPAAVDRAMAYLSPTWFTGSPAFHLGLLDYFKAADRAPVTKSLRFMRSSSAPFPASAIAPYENLFGVPLLENYGMTETASTVCSNLPPPGLRKPGSVGRPIGAEIRVVDRSGDELPPGSEGEVLLRGPSVIKRYASGEAGPEHFADGWLRTGDVGRLDEDGCLFILGRTKELIKRGGHSVYPLEVDSLILSHPAVTEAISFSLEHPTLGEELVAVFVSRADNGVDGDDIRHFLEGKISTYKIPTAILRVEEIPKSATGKTARRAMRSAFAREFALKGARPCSDLETALLEVWQNVTGTPGLGVTDNLFVHGGDPIRAQRVCDDLLQLRAVAFSLKDIMRNPTVRMQASLALSKAGSDVSIPSQLTEISK